MPGTYNERVSFTSNGGDGSVSVSMVVTPSLSSIEVLGPNTARAGETVQLTTNCLLTDATQRACNTVIWASSVPAVATVNPVGLVTAVSVGVTELRATSEGVTGRLSFEGAPPGVVSVEVLGPETVAAGREIQLDTTCRFSNATEGVCAQVNWISSRPTVATVDSFGRVTGVSVGSTEVSARSDGITSGVHLVSVTPSEVVTVTVTGNSDCELRTVTQLAATCGYSDGGADACPSPSWRSSQAVVASVGTTGLVQCSAAGTAEITAVQDRIESAQFSLAVLNPIPVINSVSPSTVFAGGPALQVLLTGTGFLGSSEVRAGGRFVPSVFASETHLRATIPESALSAAASLPVVVENSSPGGGVSAPTTLNIQAVDLASIAIAGSISAPAGRTTQLLATCLYNDGSRRSCPVLTWSSNVPSVATVSSSGIVSAHSQGATDITATAGSTTSPAFRLTTSAPVVTSVEVLGVGACLTGEVVQLGARCQDSSGAVSSCLTPTWFANPASIATISATGQLSCIGAGDVSVVATQDGIDSVPAVVRVGNPIPVLGGITPQEVLRGGSTFAMTLTGTGFTPTSIASLAGVPLATTYLSSSQLRATVQASSITTLGDFPVFVTNPPPGGGTSSSRNLSVMSVILLSITVAGGASMPAGRTVQLVPTCTYSNAIGPCTDLVWSSNAPSIASVDPSGVVFGLAAGVADISVTQGTVSNLPFRVTVGPPVVHSVTVTGGSSCTVGTTIQLGTNCIDSLGDSSTCASPVWTPSLPAVATVSSTGLVSCLSAGDVGIVATQDAVPSPPFILQSLNPVPAITSLSPSSVSTGAPEFTLIVNGSGFVTGSVVRVSGTDLSTTFVSSSRLNATVPASRVAAPGDLLVVVTNPAPGGGTSGATMLAVRNAQVTNVEVSGTSAAPAGRTVQLTATCVLSDGSRPTCSSPSWASSASAIASIGAAGLVTAKLVGSANITATQGAISSAAFAFAVQPAVIEFVTVTGATSCVAGTNVILAASCRDSLGETTTCSAPDWAATPSGVGTISSAGLLQCLVGGDISVTAAQGGATSTPYVVHSTNPTPVLTSISPSTGLLGIEFTLAVSGSGFVPNSVVIFAGSPLVTSYVSGTSMTAVVTETSVDTVGSHLVGVSNSAPGGGTSGTSTYEVTNAPCADTTTEGGPELWDRNDIAFCATANNSLPTLSEARLLCAAGWRVCSATEYRARNDSCQPLLKFSGTLDDGADCMMHDDGPPHAGGGWECNNDLGRSEGTCPGQTSGSLLLLGLGSLENLFSGADTQQGTLCCQ
ncbi:MAG: Ig-like domain-containing protein [Deltaproteobacteria bacterium]|nr:Ig-like domain-containing protein [Deltaproteobacteria bacterium]